MTIKRTGWNEYVRFYKDENAMRCTGQVSGNTFWGPWYDISPGEFVDNNGPGEGEYCWPDAFTPCVDSYSSFLVQLVLFSTTIGTTSGTS